jgi:hypothetical protein
MNPSLVVDHGMVIPWYTGGGDPGGPADSFSADAKKYAPTQARLKFFFILAYLCCNYFLQSLSGSLHFL